jgi:tRNA uridine 5-carboxymethylaminomethyl modification enzyme|nr:tRNA uridine-5-carboxymethylaminomethyl(34) synthesis enzyme MnmG [Sphingomonas corticis]
MMFHVEQDRSFDVAVVGGGHAGVEAAAAAARRGASVVLISQAVSAIGVMSCNPSIGGVGKGHLVREVDALDGIMARAADHAAIHHRMLNESKGAAVHGPRVQADRALYRTAVRALLGSYPHVTIVEGTVDDLRISSGIVEGVVLENGETIAARAVVLATGTFLGGRIFRGLEREAGGRVGERPANRLGERMRSWKLAMSRLKTGTPPRLDGRTIDWARLQRQGSDDAQWTMSTMSTGRQQPALACAITRTSARTHDVIREGLIDSPVASGAIDGRGPRYCPSIEDKVARFGDRDGHQIFLEPEGLCDSTVYPNGISTSLSTDTQVAFLRTIEGLKQVDVTVPGYAVEYDHIDPRMLDHRLALPMIGGLFCAGQLNGTTGYEEAAAQGLVAGANAAAYARGTEPLLLDRASSYIGVLIDDLVLQGISEPYRMLTARAEYRLSLRADNAEARLGEIARAAGLMTDVRHRHYERRAEQRERLRRDDLRSDEVDADIGAEVAADRGYAPYVARQEVEIASMRRDGAIAIPRGDALRGVAGLSSEMVERLERSAPATLDHARRIRGITPAALSALWLHARRSA